MLEPPRWTASELQEQIEVAKEIFRRERLDEPAELWKREFDKCRVEFERWCP